MGTSLLHLSSAFYLIPLNVLTRPGHIKEEFWHCYYGINLVQYDTRADSSIHEVSNFIFSHIRENETEPL